MQEMSRKNKLFTDSVIRRMTRVSLACGAINLAQGFPDFDPPKALTDRLAEVSALGPHQYPITMGAPNFRQALARKAGRFMGRTLDPETDMVVTIGSTEAMVDTIFALTIRSSCSPRILRITARRPSWLTVSRFSFRWYRRSSISTQMCWKTRSSRARRPF